MNPVLFLDLDGVLHSEPSLSHKAYLFRPLNKHLIVTPTAGV